MSVGGDSQSSADESASKTLLVADGLIAGYVDEVDILNGVSVTVKRGEIVSVIGPNGAGKSTFLKTVFGLLRARQGTVRFCGTEITGLRPHAITRLGLSYVPQLANVFPSLSVQENLELGAHDRTTLAQRLPEMYELFPRLAERRRQAAGTLSGGERQMVAFARALVPEPKLMLVDEPSAGLAPTFVDAIFKTIERINDTGVAVVMVEQNARRALAMADRGYVLELGCTRFSGKGRDLLHDERVSELYLGGVRQHSE